MEDDEAMPYDKYQKMVEKESGPFINKFIKDFFDWQNKWLQQNKEGIKKNLRTSEDKGTAWWNEILIYDTKVVDAFVLSRVTTDWRWEHNKKPGEWQKEILKYVPKNKIEIGTPAKFREWYNKREGVIDQI
jgi:hypothetical protein